MIVAVVQIPMPRRPREAAIAAQTKSAPTFRALAGKGLLRKDFLNGEAGGGGVYYWTSREAAEAWYTPAWRAKAKDTFGAEPDHHLLRDVRDRRQHQGRDHRPRARLIRIGIGMTLQRRVLLWMCVLVAVNQFGFGAMVPSVPLYAQSFGVPASAIGMAIAAYGLARFMSAVPAGQLSDILGRRQSLAIGGLVSAVGNLWCAWATSYPEFIIARFVAGFGAGLVLTTGNIVLADISTPEVRGRMIAIYQGTFLFSVGLGPFPGGLLAEHFGLSAPFLFSGLGAFLATVVAWFAVEETREMARSSAGASAITVSFLAQMRTLMRNVGYVLVSLISLMNAVVRTGGLFAIIPLLATARLGISISAIGFGYDAR